MASLVFHAGADGKVQKNAVVKALCHTHRKTYGRYENHKNEDIDKSMTKYNLDYVYQGAPIEQVIADRLDHEYKGAKKLRSDAVVMRDIMVSPPSELFIGMAIGEKQKLLEKFIRDAKPFLDKEFGKRNVLGASGHLDETNPHVHFAMMPLTKDGRVSQKDFFKNPGDLKRQHRDFRKHMQAKGWPIAMENKYESLDVISLPVYKKNAAKIEEKRAEQSAAARALREDVNWQARAEQQAYEDVHGRVLREEREKLEEWEWQLKQRESGLEKFEEHNSWRREERIELERKVNDREKAVMAKEIQLGDREAALTDREQRMEQIAQTSTAVALTLLKDDPQRQRAYTQIKAQPIYTLDAESLQGVLASSIEDVRLGKRQQKGGAVAMRQAVQEQSQRDDGPEL